MSPAFKHRFRITSKLGDVCAVSLFQISNTKNEALFKILYQNQRHKCGEAQAGTPAQRLAAVVRWAALADNDQTFKVHLYKFINYKMNYLKQKILNHLK